MCNKDVKRVQDGQNHNKQTLRSHFEQYTPLNATSTKVIMQVEERNILQ